MKSMLWHKLNKGLSSTLNWMTKYMISIYFQSTQHIPLHFAKSYISEKELRYISLGHNPQFQLSIPLTLPDALGRNTTFHSQNCELSPLAKAESHHFGFLNRICGKPFLSAS